MPKNKVKLILNMLLVANGAIPRGGNLGVKIEDPDTNLKITLRAAGPMLRVPPKFLEMHATNQSSEAVDAHSIQAYYTLLLATESKMVINILATAEEILFTATEAVATVDQ